MHSIKKGNPMKVWKIAAVVTSLLVVPLIIRKCKRQPLPIQTDENKRYDIEEYIADQEL